MNTESKNEIKIDTSVIKQENGQRKYGGPPPGWEGPPPARGSEVFVGKLPRHLYEDRLVPALSTGGLRVYELRLMVDFSGTNRGFCFVTYATPEEARDAVRLLNNFEILPGKHIGVMMSVDNRRLFVGGIPKERSREDVKIEMEKLTEEVVDAILYPSATDKSKNRGFAFVEYTTHKAAAMARKKLMPDRVQLWGQPICVDWAEPEQQVDDDTMSRVKKLYIRNLMLSTTEETIRALFESIKADSVEKVKKLKDFAFVHFVTRQDALDAMDKTNGTRLDGAEIEVVLAKPRDTTYMRYVKNAQKMQQQQGGLQMPPPAAPLGGTHPALIAAAANKLYAAAVNQQQFIQLPYGGDVQMMSSTGSSTPPSPATSAAALNGGGAGVIDPVLWAYMGTPMIDPGYVAYQHAVLANTEHNRMSRGAAGMRAAGFQAYVNSQVKRTKRRFADAALLNELCLSPGSAGVVPAGVGQQAFYPPSTLGFVPPPPPATYHPQPAYPTSYAPQHPQLLFGPTPAPTAPSGAATVPMTTPTTPPSTAGTGVAAFFPQHVSAAPAPTLLQQAPHSHLLHQQQPQRVGGGWVEQLEQYCVKLGLGVPTYEAMVIATKDAINRDLQFYIYKARILSVGGGGAAYVFQSSAPSLDAAEAKESAAVAAAVQLGLGVLLPTQAPTSLLPQTTTAGGYQLHHPTSAMVNVGAAQMMAATGPGIPAVPAVNVV